MSEQTAAAPVRQAAAPERGARPGLMLQRKCACGQHTVDGGECAECRKKRLAMQRWPSDRPRPDASARMPDALSARVAGEGSGRDLSHVPAQTPALRTAPRVQRVPDGAAPATPDAAAEAAVEETEAPPQSAGPASPESAPPEAPSSGPESEAAPGAASPEAGGALLVDDDAADVSGGQLRKAEFLDRLESAVCAQANEALAAAGRSTEGCPYLAQAFGHYRGKSAAQVESGLRRYAPETRNARTAEEYIPIVAARVRQGVERWVSTGEISGVPEGMSLPGGGVLGALGGLGGGLMGSIGGMAAGIGSLLFKADEGGARPADDPAAVHDALGAGRPLESAVRGRMERAFGRGFSGVRMHTDATAGRLSREQNARAFAVGGHVAFAAGAYRPGTPAGDALIAHELAHTVQQGSGAVATQAKSASGASYGALEADADRSAAGVVARLWGGARETGAAAALNAGPALRSGLSLQRCSATKKQTKVPESVAKPPVAPGTVAPGGPEAAVEAPAPAAEDPAAVRARAIEALTADTVCKPTPVTMAELAAIPGASNKNFGWTKQADARRAFTPGYDRQKHEGYIARLTPATLSFDHMVYVGPGEHRYGSETRTHPSCGDAQLPLSVEVTPKAADLFKAGEVEHCQDLHRAFALTYGRWNAAAAAVNAEGRFPATSLGDATTQIKAKISQRMGIPYDDVRTVFECLSGKSKLRDDRGWHDVDVNLAKEKRAPDCKKVVHVLDESRIVPEVGKHPSAELVKGCNEPTTP